MRVLLIKMSSMGDLIHTLPALTDAQNSIADIKFDWVVEDSFKEIPGWHPAVDQIIPVKFRKWRNNVIANFKNGEIGNFAAALRARHYDLVIDAQGLFKSAVLAKFVRAQTRSGFVWRDAREPMASLFYGKRISAANAQHAIDKIRNLFAGALGYQLPTSAPNYGINWRKYLPPKLAPVEGKPYLFFLHGTTWQTKHWPDEHWQQLAAIAGENNFDVHMTWATAEQKERVQKLVAMVPTIKMLPHLSLTEAMVELLGAKAAVAVDTGFGHLAAAIGVPAVSIYGPTDPKRIGAVGENQLHIQIQAQAQAQAQVDAQTQIQAQGQTQTQLSLPCIPCESKNCRLPQGALQKFPPCMSAVEPKFVWEKLLTVLVS